MPIGRQWPVESSVSIGSGSWLGTGVIVLPGARIGRNVAVGAGSVVVGELPDHCVAVGVPARVIKQYVAGRRLGGDGRISGHRGRSQQQHGPQRQAAPRRTSVRRRDVQRCAGRCVTDDTAPARDATKFRASGRLPRDEWHGTRCVALRSRSAWKRRETGSDADRPQPHPQVFPQRSPQEIDDRRPTAARSARSDDGKVGRGGARDNVDWRCRPGAVRNAKPSSTSRPTRRSDPPDASTNRQRRVVATKDEGMTTKRLGRGLGVAMTVRAPSSASPPWRPIADAHLLHGAAPPPTTTTRDRPETGGGSRTAAVAASRRSGGGRRSGRTGDGTASRGPGAHGSGSGAVDVGRPGAGSGSGSGPTPGRRRCRPVVGRRACPSPEPTSRS